VRKDFDVVTPLGRLGRVGAGGGDDVKGRVIRELFFVEDGLEMFVLVFGVEKVVVGELGE